MPANVTDSTSHDPFQYRIAFGCWINDMRNSALPLQNWPAPHCDDRTVEGVVRTFDVIREAGYQFLDTFGLYATGEYPPDIVSAFGDEERNRQLDTIFREAADRELRMSLPLGLMTWGYDRIIREDPSVRGLDQDGNPHPHAMCGAKEKSWSYVEKIIDTMFQRHDFGAVHLESADLGYCMCPECTGQFGVVGYNARINARAADYIKSRHPDVVVYSCPISWALFTIDETGQQPKLTGEDLAHIVELSDHIDIFMDQGHHGRLISWEDVPRLNCAYGTSGGLWSYHGSRQDRLSYFLAYPMRAANHLKDHHAHGTRACLYYQGPMVNPAVEVNSSVAGRIMCDPGRDAGDALEEVIEVYYRPRSADVRRKLADVFIAVEEAYFGQWKAEAFHQTWRLEMPGEFIVGNLFGTQPDAATFLAEPYLDADARVACGAGIRAALAELQPLIGQAEDDGRIERMIRALSVMHHLLATVMMARGEPWC